MASLTRKRFLQKASTGAAAIGALAAVPGMATAATLKPTAANAHRAARVEAAQPFVVYVRDPRVDELVVMMGGEEIVVRDSELVSRLWHAGHSASHRPARSKVR